MNTTTDITLFKVNLDPNLPEERKNTILSGFLPIYQQIQDTEQEVTAITQADVSVFTPALAKKAKQVRLKLVGLRGKDGLKGMHDELKLGAKLEGQAIDYLEREPRETMMRWEEQLREIEEFPERERQRIIAEAQEQRFEQIKGYISQVDLNDPVITTLGELSEEKWEEVFTKYRNAWNRIQEDLRKAALRRERLDIATPYSLFIEEFENIAWESLTEKQFTRTVAEAKTAYEEKQAEAERLRKQIEDERKAAEAKAEADKKAAEEKAARERSRIARLKGCEQREDGIYYAGKKILTYKSIEAWDEEVFDKFAATHAETYEADLAEKKRQEDAERQAAIDKAAAQAKIEEQQRLHRESEERTRKEIQEKEVAILKQKKEAEARSSAPDKEKLLELRNELANLGYPECTTENGIKTVNGVQTLIGKVIGYIDEKLEKI